MRYDVFLVSALADSEMADMLVRRLKALKFKVRHDKKRAHTTPTPKDIKDANSSQSIIVLWSEAACDTTQSDSDWVHAMAHQARSRPGVLVQTGLDKSVPDEPFDKDKRYMLAGLTSRTLIDPYYDLVEDLGNRDGRKGLRQWLDMKASDKTGKAAWKSSHPTDPLALVGVAKPKPAPKPKPIVTGAAALAGVAAVAAPLAGRSYHEPEEADDTGKWMIAAIMAGILAMLWLGWMFRSKPAVTAIGNACLPSVLEAGGISDDTDVNIAAMTASLVGKFSRLGFDWMDVNIRGPIATLTGTAPTAAAKASAFDAGRAAILTDNSAAGLITLVVDGISVEGGAAGVGAALANIDADASLDSCQTAFTDTMSERNIEFEMGSAAINPASARLLDALTGAAILCAEYQIEIAGHSDSTGDPDFNLILSQNRASAVAEYLKAKGVDSGNLKAFGYGSAHPLDTAQTDEAYARNRRTEFTLSTR